jgi:hypothetical protein
MLFDSVTDLPFHQAKVIAQVVWQLPWGERKNVTVHHNELLITFSTNVQLGAKKFKVHFRLLNDGVFNFSKSYDDFDLAALSADGKKKQVMSLTVLILNA